MCCSLRLSSLLWAWLEHSSQGEARDRAELKSLRARLTMFDGESANVIGLVRKGLMSADDPQIEKELGQIAAQKRAVAADIDILERKLVDPARAITPDILDRFGKLVASTMRDRASPLRKQYIDLLVDKVEVGDIFVRITGSRSRLARAASGTAPHMVPKAERKWRTRHDRKRHSTYWEISVWLAV